MLEGMTCGQENRESGQAQAAAEILSQNIRVCTYQLAFQIKYENVPEKISDLGRPKMKPHIRLDIKILAIQNHKRIVKRTLLDSESLDCRESELLTKVGGDGIWSLSSSASS